jgi:hypothetical protein
MPYFQDFLNFPFLPGSPQETPNVSRWNQQNDLGNWEFSSPGSGNANLGINGAALGGSLISAPSAVGDSNGGILTLNSTSDVQSAVQYDYIQAQRIGNDIQLNGLNKYNWFMWNLSLASATLTAAIIGCFNTNTNLMGTNIANGFGFMVNQQGTGAPAAGTWNTFVCNGSTTQFTNYGLLPTNPSDTNVHTFGVEFVSSGVAGAGAMSFWIDGSQVELYTQGGAANFPTAVLRQSFGMGNTTAAAQTMNVFWCGSDVQR